METDKRFHSDRFPRSSKYNPDWILSRVGSGSANVLWLTEWLADKMNLTPGMRVLDLGCGSAMSSIFLHREYGVQVWATDLWFSASENLLRIREAGVGDGVFPIHSDARSLPYANQIFDAIVSIDSFMYYGTDDHYLSYLARFLKPGGLLGITGAGVTQEVEGPVPEHLREWWSGGQNAGWCLHSAAWWRRHWEKSGILDMELADSMPDGWKLWLDWHKIIAPHNSSEINALASDKGRNLGYFRVVGRRRNDVTLEEPIISLPAEFTPKPLLREKPAEH